MPWKVVTPRRCGWLQAVAAMAAMAAMVARAAAAVAAVEAAAVAERDRPAVHPFM